MTKTLTHESRWIRTGIPVTIGLCFYMLYELTNAPGQFWTHPDSVMNMDKSLSVAASMLLRSCLYLFSAMHAPDPSAVMQTVIAIAGALTCMAAYLFALHFSDASLDPLQRNMTAWITASLFGLAPAFWSAVSQGHGIVLQMALLTCSLLLWTRFFRKRTGLVIVILASFLFGTGLIFMQYAVILLLVPFLLWLSNAAERRLETGTLKLFPFISLLFILGGILAGHEICRAAGDASNPLLSLLSMWTHSRAPAPGTGMPPSLSITLGTRTLGEILENNVGIAGWICILFFPVLHAVLKLKGCMPFWITLMFMIYATGALMPVGLGLRSIPSLGFMFLPALIVFIPVIMTAIQRIIRLLPGKWIWIALIPLLVTGIRRVQTVSLSHDRSYPDFHACLMENFSEMTDSHPHSPAERTGNNIRIRQIFQNDSLVIRWHRSFKQWTRESGVLENTAGSTRMHLAAIWADIGLYWFDRIPEQENREYRIAYTNLALDAYQVAGRLDMDHFHAAEYADRQARLWRRKGQYTLMADFSTLALNINPYHYGANERLYHLHRHIDEYREAMRCVRRMIKSRPDAGELWMDLAEMYTMIGRPNRARIVYLKALEKECAPRPELEKGWSAPVKIRWLARNRLNFIPSGNMTNR
ncbi:hypothetical protein JW948_01080 [bacterium]|nr:hypothetical protein [bacterium]